MNASYLCGISPGVHMGKRGHREMAIWLVDGMWLLTLLLLLLWMMMMVMVMMVIVIPLTLMPRWSSRGRLNGGKTMHWRNHRLSTWTSRMIAESSSREWSCDAGSSKATRLGALIDPEVHSFRVIFSPDEPLWVTSNIWGLMWPRDVREISQNRASIEHSTNESDGMEKLPRWKKRNKQKSRCAYGWRKNQ